MADTCDFLKTYYEALGEFIHAFSYAEISVQDAMTSILDIPYRTSLPLLRGMGLKQKIDSIRSFYKEYQLDIDPLLDETLSQLVHILNFRNDLLHSGALWNEDGSMFVDNLNKTTNPKKYKETPVSVELLRTISRDLEKIMTRLEIYTYVKLTNTEQFEADKKEASKISFQYKPYTKNK
ncbi:MAG: hypothetical protein AAF569_06135 [Pseudomonadota bacterium]